MRGLSEKQSEGSNCPNRLKKVCKCFGGDRGCTRKEVCDFSHDTLSFNGKNVNDHTNKSKNYACISCKSECLVQDIIQDKEVNCCLNCEDWAKNKQNVINEEWSLFDQDGDLLNSFV